MDLNVLASSTKTNWLINDISNVLETFLDDKIVLMFVTSSSMMFA